MIAFRLADPTLDMLAPLWKTAPANCVRLGSREGKGSRREVWEAPIQSTLRWKLPHLAANDAIRVIEHGLQGRLSALVEEGGEGKAGRRAGLQGAVAGNPRTAHLSST